MTNKRNKQSELHPFFYPKNVLVIGVSPEPANMGKNIVLNLLKFGYQGEILSVGVKKGVICGQRIYQSLNEIDHQIDLAVILTPAKTVPGVLEQCGRKGIKCVAIETGGFSETGKEGLSVEDACLEIAGRYGIRFMGPNCLAVINLENGLALPFTPLRKDLTLGQVSILSQSGGVALSYLEFLADENIGVNKMISVGNKLNLNENDLLPYLIEDEGTEIILVYLEGFSDGRKFVEIASKSKKPILVYKSNRFETSSQIAHSHTTALLADDQLVDYALEQAGCIRVNSMDDAMDCLRILTLPPLKGNRLGLMSRSGGHAVISADACSHYDFEFPPFPKEFLDKIKGRLRANVIWLQNPLDMGDMFDLVFYKDMVEDLLKLEDLDGILLAHGYSQEFGKEDSRSFIKELKKLAEQYQKPVAVAVTTQGEEIDYLKRNVNIPIFTSAENAARGLYMSHWWATKNKDSLELPAVEDINISGAKEILDKATGQESLLLHESVDLIKCYGFSAPEYRLAGTSDEAVSAWQAIGGSVAMKVNRPHVSHKTDVGFIKLGLNSEEDIRKAYHDFEISAAPEKLEVFIQAMITDGVELILGGKQDRTFGPVILFGLGGIFVEAIGDIVWRTAPVTRHEARTMIDQIKGGKILSGSRGKPPCDIAALEGLLVRLSRMMTDFPVIREIDINPVKVAGVDYGAQALDARVILKQQDFAQE